ncbi:MAG: hypothetical protein V2B19_03505 [Pseudomonadota bacterium]
MISISILLVTIGVARMITLGCDGNILTAFDHLFLSCDAPGAYLLIMALLAGGYVASKIDNSLVDNTLSVVERHPVQISGVVFCVISLGSFYIYYKYNGYLLSMDEFMPCFQARIFAEGKLWGQYPPELTPWLVRSGYFTVFSLETGRVVSEYWPGFALLLTPFMKAGAPWILNPLISGATIALLWYYTKKVFPDSDAPGWVLLLTVASPVFAANGISFYSMSAHLFFNLIYATLLLTLSSARLFSAGIVGSFALVLHHPVPHLLFALPWIVWIGAQKGGIKKLGILFTGYLPLSLLIGLGWIFLKLFVENGNLLLAIGREAGALSSTPEADGLVPPGENMITFIFYKTAALAGGILTIPDADLLWVRLMGLLKLFVWAVPGLPILSFLGVRHIRRNRHLLLWGWAAISTLIGYIFVPFSQGHGWGFRYFHSTWLTLPLLATAFLMSTPINGKSWRRLVGTIAIVSLVFCLGFRFFQMNQFISNGTEQRSSLKDGTSHLCFMAETYPYLYTYLMRNDPFLRNSNIYLQSLGFQKDRELMDTLFPGARKISFSESHSLWEIPFGVKGIRTVK